MDGWIDRKKDGWLDGWKERRKDGMDFQVKEGKTVRWSGRPHVNLGTMSLFVIHPFSCHM